MALAPDLLGQKAPSEREHPTHFACGKGGMTSGWLRRPDAQSAVSSQVHPARRGFRTHNAGAHLLPEAGARHERSNCLGCQGCLVYFLVLHLLGLPGRPLLQQGIAHRHQLMPTRRQRHFFAFSRSEQSVIQGVDLRMTPCRHERPHGPHRAHRRATAPHGAPAPEGPTGAIAGRYANHRRDVLPRARPQRGAFQPQRPGTHRPHARDTL